MEYVFAIILGRAGEESKDIFVPYVMSNFALFQLPVQTHCTAQGMLWRTPRGGEKVGGSWSPAWTERYGMHIHSHLFPKAAHCFTHVRRTFYRSASNRGGVLKGLAMSLKFILKITFVDKRFQEGVSALLCTAQGRDAQSCRGERF